MQRFQSVNASEKPLHSLLFAQNVECSAADGTLSLSSNLLRAFTCLAGGSRFIVADSRLATLNNSFPFCVRHRAASVVSLECLSNTVVSWSFYSSRRWKALFSSVSFLSRCSRHSSDSEVRSATFSRPADSFASNFLVLGRCLSNFSVISFNSSHTSDRAPSLSSLTRYRNHLDNRHQQYPLFVLARTLNLL